MFSTLLNFDSYYSSLVIQFVTRFRLLRQAFKIGFRFAGEGLAFDLNVEFIAHVHAGKGLTPHKPLDYGTAPYPTFSRFAPITGFSASPAATQRLFSLLHEKD